MDFLEKCKKPRVFQKTKKQNFRPYVSILAELGSDFFVFWKTQFFLDFLEASKKHTPKTAKFHAFKKPTPHEGPFCKDTARDINNIVKMMYERSKMYQLNDYPELKL